MGRGKKRNKSQASPGSSSIQPVKRQPDYYSTSVSPSSHNMNTPPPAVGTPAPQQVTQSQPPAYLGQYVAPHLQMINGGMGQYGSPMATPTTQPTQPLQSPQYNTPQQNIDSSLLQTIAERLASIESSQKNTELKLKKLDKIESSIANMTIRVSTIESRVKDVDDKVTALEASRAFDSQLCDELKKNHDQFENLLKSEKSKNDKLLSDIDQLKRDNEEIRDDVVDSQSRLMRDNLLFFNVPEETTRESRISENCQDKVYDFCINDLDIPDAAMRFKLDRAHRTGKFEHGKTRPIVAKFNFYGDKMEVKRKVREKNPNSLSIRISDQFPKAIQERRKKLIPYFVHAKSQNKQTVLSYDTLYIDNRRYTASNPPPGPVPDLPPRRPRQQATGGSTQPSQQTNEPSAAGPEGMDHTSSTD